MIEPIDVRERGRAIVPDGVVDATPPEFWKAADCKVLRAAGDGRWTLEAGDSVGVTRIVTSLGDVTLRVRPKLDTANVFFLADYAYEQRHDPLKLLDHDDVGLEAVLRDPTAALLVWHARAIHRFAARWLRRDYRIVDRTYEGKVQGRVLVSRYVSHHLAIGDAASVPCRAQERTQDTPNNRLLKAGLRFILGASHAMPVPAAGRAVMRAVKATLPLFAHVSDVPLSPQLLRSTTSRGPQRHYAPILAATASLLRNELMGEELSSTPNTTAFMWRMPVLFQEALRGMLDSTPGLRLEAGAVGSATIRDATGKRRSISKVDPDLVLPATSGRTLLIDTKYKDAMPSGHEVDEDVTVVADRHHVKVSRADIYQMVAYRNHEKWPHSTGVLLYPIVLSEGDTLPEPLRVEGFGDPVWLMFVDIGRHAAKNLRTFVEGMHSLSAKATE